MVEHDTTGNSLPSFPIKSNVGSDPITHSPIAIIGMSCRLPGANNPWEFWENLKADRCHLGPMPEDRWQALRPHLDESVRPFGLAGGFVDKADHFDADFFGIAPWEAKLIDPQQRMMLELAWQCLEDAGVNPMALKGSSTGVFMGTCIFEYRDLQQAYGCRIEGQAPLGYCFGSLLPNRISYLFDLRGPSLPIDAACASSVCALDAAVHSLCRGECELALAGAVNFLCGPSFYTSFSQLGMLSPLGRCRPFDKAANGYVRGEGGAILLLKPLQKALADGDQIHGVICGTAINHGGHARTITSPNPYSQSQVIADAVKSAGIPFDTITYIETHGTGTPLGDPIEIAGLTRAYRLSSQSKESSEPASIGLGAVKANIGHLEPAAGMAGVLKVLLAMRAKQLPPVHGLNEVNPRINLGRTPFYFVKELCDWEQRTDARGTKIPRRAGVSSFGFGGTNAHLILEEPPKPQPTIAAKAPRTAHLLPLSGKSEKALRDQARQYIRWFANNPAADIADVCFTAGVGRCHFEYRACLAVESIDDAQKQCERLVSGDALSGLEEVDPSQPPELAWHFETPVIGSSGLSAWRDQQPILRESLEEWDSLLDEHLETIHATELLLAESEFNDDWKRRTAAAVGTQLAVGRLWQSWGINPTHVMATGLGEVTAAVLTGLISASDGVRLAIAWLNGHSSLGRVAGSIAVRQADRPLYLASQRRWLHPDQRLDLAEWIRAICDNEGQNEPNQTELPRTEAKGRDATAFALITSQFAAKNSVVFQSIHSSTRFAEDIRDHWTTAEKPTLLPAVAPYQTNSLVLQSAQLYVQGLTPDFAAWDAPWPRRKLSLPTYPFQRRRYWFDVPAETATANKQSQRVFQARTPADWMKTPDQISAALQPIAAKLPQELGLTAERQQSTNRLLESMSLAYIGQAMQRLGWRPILGSRFNPEDLRVELKIASPHRRLFSRLLDLLVAGGCLVKVEEQYQCNKVPDSTHPIDSRRALMDEYPEIAIELALLERCGEKLADVLRGVVAPLSLLFPVSGIGVDQFYRESSTLRLWNELIAQSIHELLNERPSGKNVRILEVGAGTGGTTNAILPLLPVDLTEYCFTDRTSGLLSGSEQRFASSYPYLEFQTLDMERDPISQGFVPHHYDLIVASNVLHAIRDLDQAVAHCRDLLAPSGTLVLLEGTQKCGFLDLIFGLLDGWWCFDDAVRTDYPLIDAEQWKALLCRQGFAATEVIRPEGFAQFAVLLARGPSVVFAPSDHTSARVSPLDHRANGRAAHDGQEGVAKVNNGRVVGQAELDNTSLLCQLKMLETGERRRQLVGYISTQTQQILRLPDLPPLTDGFFDLGLDSLTSVELRNRLQVLLGSGITISDTLAFDYPTVEKMADYLVEAISPALPRSPEPMMLAPAVKGCATEAVAIVGLACRLPGAADAEEFWQLLEEGKDAIREIPRDRWDIDRYYDSDPDVPGKMVTRCGGFVEGVDQFDPGFFSISPREAIEIDPQQRLLLEMSWLALENAGIDPASLAGSRTGVYAGIATNDYSQLLTRGGEEAIGQYLGTGTAHSAAVGRISFVLGLEGPSLAIDTACSSSLVAVNQAIRGLLAGDCELALAGGVNAMLSPELTIHFSHGRFLSPDGRCKTFDDSADGYVRSEGCGVLVLKRLSDAERAGDRILAVIRGSAVNQDGASSGLTVPNGPSQERVIRQALKSAELSPAQIDYLEAHGTGTSLGDPIELQAAARVYGDGRAEDRPLLVGSVKTNIGHLEAAAGVASIIKVTLAMQHGVIPPQLHFHTPNTRIAWDELPIRVVTRTTPWPNEDQPRRAAVSGFAFQGTNAHVVLESYPNREGNDSEALPERPLHLLPLSGKSESALRALAGRYANWFVENPTAELADICFTAGVGRSHFPYRAGLVVHSIADAQDQCERLVRGDSESDELAVGKIPQSPRLAWLFEESLPQPGCLAELHSQQPLIRQLIEEWEPLVGKELGKSVTHYLTTADRSLTENPKLMTVAAVMAAMALGRLWKSWGIEPQQVIGVGLGEVVAAALAGMISTAEAIRLAAAWSPTGPIDGSSIEVDSADLPVLLVSQRRWLALGERLNPEDWLTAAQNDAKQSTALASAFLSKALSVTSPTVIQSLLGPSPLANQLLSDWPTAEKPALLPTGDLEQTVVHQLGQLYVHGFKPDFRGWDAPWPRQKQVIPTYPFQKKRYWVSSPSPVQRDGELPSQPLEDRSSVERLLYEIKWIPISRPSVHEARSEDWLIAGSGDWVAKFAHDASSLGHTVQLCCLGDCFRVLDSDVKFSGVIVVWESTDELWLLIELIRRLIAMDRPLPSGLTVVTQRGISIGTDERVDPHATAVWGLGRSLQVEHPRLGLRLLDIVEPHSQVLLDALAIPQEDQLVVRGNEMRAARLGRYFNGRKVLSIGDQQTIRPDVSYLITGGLGALGLAAAEWLVSQGAQHIVLTSRRAANQATKLRIANMRESQHASIVVAQADVGDAEQVESLMSRFGRDWPSLAGIVHAAGVVDDGLIAEQTPDRFAKVMRPKVQGGWNLHEASRSHQLDFFVLYSSAASVLGSAGQASYAAANSFLDGLAALRRSLGLPGLSINWGLWAGAGMASDSVAAANLTRQGLGLLRPSVAHMAMDSLLASNAPCGTVIDVDWKQFSRSAGGGRRPLLERLLETPPTKIHHALRQQLQQASTSQWPLILSEYLQQKLQRLLGLEERLEPNAEFSDLGMDSLMVIQLRNWLQTDLDNHSAISNSLAFDYSTIEKLTEHLIQNLGSLAAEKVTPSASLSKCSNSRPNVMRTSPRHFLVKPASEVPLPAVFLSVVDQVLPFNVAFCHLLEGQVEVDSFCQSLSRTLRFFPEMSGGLRGSACGFFVDPAAGAVPVEVEHSSLSLPDSFPRCLTSFGERTSQRHLLQSLPSIMPSHRALNANHPLFAVKIVQTRCNRSIVGFRCSHLLHDYASFQMFVRAWTELLNDPDYQPQICRDRLAMDRLAKDASIADSTHSHSAGFMSRWKAGIQSWGTLSVAFGDQQLQQIKAAATDPATTRGITPAQALQALLWKRLALLRWEHSPASTAASIAQIVDLRERVTGISSDFVGNGSIGIKLSEVTIGELGGLSLAKAAAVLHRETVDNIETKARRQISATLQRRSLGLLRNANMYCDDHDSIRINTLGLTLRRQRFLGLDIQQEAVFVPAPRAWYCTIAPTPSGCLATISLPSRLCNDQTASRIVAPAD